MQLHIEEKEIIDLLDTPIVQQTSYWSKVKDKQGLTSCAFDYKVRNSELYLNVGGHSYTQADFILFTHYYNRDNCIAYVPYGPEVEPSQENQGEFLEELSECLRPQLPAGCTAIRYDLNWRTHWDSEDDYDENGVWLGPPEKRFQEFRLNYGTCNHNLRRCNSDILPTNTVLLDLTLSEEELLAAMKPKTRYNIHLAQRKGVEVTTGSLNELETWYKLYLDTAHRNGLHVNDIRYFQSVLAAKMENRDLPVQVKLLIASLDGEPLAAMFLLISSHRATYLYGASSSCRRNCMSTYALQWEAIRTARACGCTEYDMFGISPCALPSHPMYGLYRFKMGFGGEVYHQLGCWDYPLDESAYSLLQAGELSEKGYYV